jgi:glycerol-1-phosphatase
MSGTIAERFDAFLLDLDGVLFRGDASIDGAGASVRELRELGKRVVFVTNNSARTPVEVTEHLASVGVEAAPEEVETSALATASLLARRGVRRAFVVGERGLREALSAEEVAIVQDDPEVVVVGWDRRLTYDRLRDAAVAVQRGASLVASNADTSYPAPDGTRWPGAGSILAAIEATCQVRAEVVGKPNGAIFESALARAGGGRPLVVGDRLDTDIEGAARLGWSSLLVLTGISTRSEAEAGRLRPTFIAEDLRGLFDPAGVPNRDRRMLAIATNLEATMTRLEDFRKTAEGTFEAITPASAQRLAKNLLEPGAAKEQVAKTAADLIEWSQRNRERVRDLIKNEIARQMANAGVATQDEVDALKKRVRTLERAAEKPAARSSAAKRKAAPRARKPAAAKPTATREGSPGPSAGS